MWNCGANHQTVNRNSDIGFLWVVGLGSQDTEGTYHHSLLFVSLFYICLGAWAMNTQS